MPRRHELTDTQWALVEPLMPPPSRGRRWADHRTVVDGVLYWAATGVQWRDLPERYGPWQTCYDRFVRWRRDGTWDRLLARAQARSDAVGEVIWEVSLDSTVARAHQHAAGARHQPSQADQKRGSSTRSTRPSGAAEAGSRPSST